MKQLAQIIYRRLRASSSFSPRALFASGEQGIWLDPSDLTTMFSDRAGSVPVTTPGTVVGMRLDKSKGLVLGPELVTNGTFDTDVSGWTASTANVSAVRNASGQIEVTNNGLGAVYQIIATVIGRTYTYQVSWVQKQGGGRFNIGTAIGSAANVQETSAGNIKRSFVATSTTTFINLGEPAGGVGIVNIYDNISVKLLPGNHAVAPTDAARPTYGIEPKTGRRNLLTRTEEFNDAVWAEVLGATVSANTTSAPDGTLTADTVTFNTTNGNRIENTSATAVNGETLTFSLWMKGSGTIRLNVGAETGNTTETVFTLTSIWVRYSVSVTLVSPTGLRRVMVIWRTGNTASAVDIWGAQLELGSTATAYQKVTTAFDVTEAGVPTCHYVQYDGSDDSLSTSSIDFTATNKMSVFAGVRKLSDAAQGAFVELSASVSSNAGAFAIQAPRNTGVGNYSLFIGGTVLQTVNPTGFTAPINNVLTGLGDISGDLATLRVNGTQAAQSTSDQGTGNFGNYPLFIGRRNNATLPFNGRDYGIIIAGKAASASEITSTEAWLAAKTAEVTL